MLYQRVPKAYHKYIDVFSKHQSNKLPEHGIHDCKIKLTGENNIGYRPLYRQSLEELEATKKYIEEYLVKGYIKRVYSSFTSLILFARKKNRGLRLYINYRRLNKIIKKDRYPLLLIEETL
jgi:hypothetical protein